MLEEADEPVQEAVQVAGRPCNAAASRRWLVIGGYGGRERLLEQGRQAV
jgi:hypothetical protein